ncbi:MAG: T9SS type A sorting domain-containing protein [Flavobacteriales bacterium]|nr:T9SS type A sorting domain-containing protein [Flavobacteriales bacterium]
MKKILLPFVFTIIVNLCFAQQPLNSGCDFTFQSVKTENCYDMVSVSDDSISIYDEGLNFVRSITPSSTLNNHKIVPFSVVYNGNDSLYYFIVLEYDTVITNGFLFNFYDSIVNKSFEVRNELGQVVFRDDTSSTNYDVGDWNNHYTFLQNSFIGIKKIYFRNSLSIIGGNGLRAECRKVYDLGIDFASPACERRVDTIYVVDSSVVVGRSQIMDLSDYLTLSPNPTNARLNIEYAISSVDDAYFVIYDGQGELVSKQALWRNQDELSIDVSQFASGGYLYTIYAGGGPVLSKKFVIR